MFIRKARGKFCQVSDARRGAARRKKNAAAPEALPAAKHIFSHIEWHMNGILLHVPAQDAPAGCVWASREALQAEYTLPGAFKSYKKLMVLKFWPF